MTTGILKTWLRALPTPLITHFEAWSAVSGMETLGIGLLSFAILLFISFLV